MIACCEICYEKYLTKQEDGTLVVDWEKVTQLREQTVLQNEGRLFAKSVQWKIDNNTPPCMCECHVHGSQVIH